MERGLCRSLLGRNPKNYTKMNENIAAYSLLYGLDRWILNFQNLKIPEWVYANTDDFKPYLEETEKVLLEGRNIVFDSTAPSHLTCIFNDLLIEGQKGLSATGRYPFAPLSLEERDIFPNDEPGDFSVLCQDLQTEFQLLPGDAQNPRIFSESLYYLLKKYTWCIPVSEEVSHVQLFEFLKVRAAVARSLYEHARAQSNEKWPLLLYCVDQSGIQSFLYNIASSKAAKSLKGRSFYLQLLMDTVLQLIVNHENIPAGMSNVLYSSGGKMYLILPNTHSVKNALKEIELDLQKHLHKTHKLELFLATGQIAFGWLEDTLVYIDEEGNEKSGQSISELWKALAKVTRRSTRRIYQPLFTDQFDAFFAPNSADGFDDEGGRKKTCAVTGEMVEVTGADASRKCDLTWYGGRDAEEGSIPEPVWVTPEVKRQSDLGYKLQQIKYYKTFYNKKRITPAHKERLFRPMNLAIYHGMADENDLKDEMTFLHRLHSFDFAIIKKINDPDHFLPSNQHNIQEGHQSAYGFTFYGGDEQAIDQEAKAKKRNVRQVVKDFSQLAGLQSEDDKHQGFHRLGVLRMDVDGLGSIFQSGMQDMQNLASYATLSAQLDLFFSGYLNTIREKGGYAGYLNIIYAGGDDIFAVGRWDIALDFAAAVREAFRSFVNGREEISISGGLALVTPKFPIAKAAQLAADAEDMAKDFKKNASQQDPSKNAFCLFDIPINWEEEFDRVKELKHKLVLFSEKDLISAGFRQRLIAFQLTKNMHLREVFEPTNKTDDKKRKGQETDDKKQKRTRDADYSFLWTSAYFISRYQGRFKKLDKKADIHVFLEELKREFFLGLQNQGRFYDLIAVAARWAELEIRSKNNKN